MSVLHGALVRLRPATRDDIGELVRIRSTPEVYARWRGGDDLVASVEEDFDDPDLVGYVIELDGRTVGWIQWEAEETPDYRHASIDIFVDPAVHGRGVGTDAVRTLPATCSTTTATTGWSSTPRPTTGPPSGPTPRSASAPSASCAGTSGAPTAAGTTASSWTSWPTSWWRTSDPERGRSEEGRHHEYLGRSRHV